MCNEFPTAYCGRSGRPGFHSNCELMSRYFAPRCPKQPTNAVATSKRNQNWCVTPQNLLKGGLFECSRKQKALGGNWRNFWTAKSFTWAWKPKKSFRLWWLQDLPTRHPQPRKSPRCWRAGIEGYFSKYYLRTPKNRIGTKRRVALRLYRSANTRGTWRKCSGR